MKEKLYWLLSVLILLSMLLGACGTDAEVTEAPAEPEVVETEEAPEPVVEATAEPTPEPEPVMVDLNAPFGAMLANMAGYNTVKADGLMTELVEDTPPFLLDVRTTEEVEASGHIEGAVNIPLAELGMHVDLLPAFDTPIVAYCGSGWRATIAMTTLYGMGFENVRALKTTFDDWVAAGNPVAEGLPENVALNAVEIDAAVLDLVNDTLATYGVKPFGVIDAEGLTTALVENSDLIVIDVRKQSELDENGVVDAGETEFIHIALEDFIANMDLWPADKDAAIVVYCGSGHRSTMALAILGANGYTNVASLKGGFGGWAAGGYAVKGGFIALNNNFGSLLANMVGYNTVKADGLMAEMVEDNPPFLLDVRTTEEVQTNGHIEGATHIPLAELAQHIDLLPAFDTPIVAYCGSGWRATIAMTALQGMGWTDVRALKTTFADWVAAGNPVAEGLPENLILNAVEVGDDLVAKFDTALATYGVAPYAGIDAEGFNTALAENSDLVVIDVRKQSELDENGVVDIGDATFIHIALEDFIANKAEWPAKDANIVIYCGSGHRSTMATAILAANGYTSVSSLKGGFGSWAAGGYPVAGGFTAVNNNFSTMLANMAGYNTVKAEDLMTEMVEDNPPFLLDVRTTEEVETNGHIEGATHIPLAELAQHIDLLPAFDTPIVAYCGSGWRATLAMTALHGMGWTDVRALKTTFADWVAAGNPVVPGLPENMVLNAAEVGDDLVAKFDTALAIYGVAPYSGMDAETFNAALAEDPNLVVIDVRTAEEVANGVIDTGEATFSTIALQDLISNKAQWPAKDARIVIYCGSGHRSTMAAMILGVNGYTNVSSLKGGFGGWVEAGFPVAEYAAP